MTRHIVILLTAIAFVGCALKGDQRHKVVIGNTVIYESLAAIQDTADVLYEQKQITLEQRQELGKYLLPLLETGRELVRLTRDWPQGEPAPSELIATVMHLRDLAEAISKNFPDSPAKQALVDKLSLAQTAALGLVLFFLRG